MAGLRNIIRTKMSKWHDINRRGIQVILMFIVMGLSLFCAAGTTSWSYALLYIALFFLLTLLGAFVVPPLVIAERGSIKKNVEPWDRKIAPTIMIMSFVTYIVSGLDYRYNSPFDCPTLLHLMGIMLFIIGFMLQIWAISSNRFFSTGVRIQTEAGHVVCSVGPYRYIRHPGYLGMILYTLATPFFLGSYWALIPAVITCALFILRTQLEDNTLKSKLSGYAEYADHIKYRLIPRLW